MFLNSRACCSFLARAAIALPVFACAYAIAPSSDGYVGVSVSEAKGKDSKAQETWQRSGKNNVTKGTSNSRERQVKTEPGRTQERSFGDRGKSYTGERRARQNDHRRNAGGSKTYDHGVEGIAGRYERDRDRSWGETASQLKHRNAANANESAFRNAAPHSNVGRISTYRDAARATLDKERDIGALDREFEYLMRERDAAIASGYYDDADSIDAELLRLDRERRIAADDLYNLRRAERDAYDSVGGPELDEQDYNIFRAMLGLD